MSKATVTALMIFLLTALGCQWGMDSTESTSNTSSQIQSESGGATPSPTPTSSPTPTPIPTPTPPLDSGWTTFTPSADTRIMYVSQSGTANCRSYGVVDVGTDPFHPTITPDVCRDPNAAYDLVRNGFPDWVLFKRGESWNLSSTLEWSKSGRAVNEKIVIGAYGSSGDRPLLLMASGQSGIRSAAYSTPSSHIAIVDLYISSPTPIQDANGLDFWNNHDDILFEGNRIEGFGLAVNVYVFNSGARFTNLRIRRNVMFNQSDTPTTGRSQAVYGGADGSSNNTWMDGVLFEENIFVHNGFPNPIALLGNFFDHTFYMAGNGNRNFTFHRNLILNNADGGKVWADHTTYDDNTFIKNAVAMSRACCGPSTTMSNNVILDNTSNSNLNETTGILMGPTQDLQITGNIIAHNHFTAYQASGGASVFGINTDTSSNTQISNNIIYNWCNPNFSSAMGFWGSQTNMRISGNDFQMTCNALLMYWAGSPLSGVTYAGNRYYSPRANPFSSDAGATMSFSQWATASGETGSWAQVMYADPLRDAATYMGQTFQSEAGYTAFETAALNQSKFSWDPRITSAQFNAYIRAGFNR